MIDWIAGRLFGPLFDGISGAAPWLWLGVCGLIAAYLLFAMPLAFKRWWQTLAAAAVVGFVVLWTWQHFDGINDLEEKNRQLEQRLEEAEQEVETLNASITDYTAAVERIEASQRRIRGEIAQARRGLDSETIQEEVQNDPGQAAADLSDRWNRLGRMSDAATGAGPGEAPPAASGSDGD